MQDFLTLLQTTFGPNLNLIWAPLILIVGLLIAFIVSRVVEAGLRRTNLDNRLTRSVAPGEGARVLGVEKLIARGIFWIILLLTLVAVFQVLGLTLIVAPLNAALALVLVYIPRVLSAILLMVIAWIVARATWFMVLRALVSLRIDARLGDESGTDPRSVLLSKTLADIAYWLVFLLFLPTILEALDLQGLLAPVQTLLNKVLGFLPNLFAAIMILVIGWFAARILQRLTTNLLVALGADRLAERVGLPRALGNQRLSSLIGILVYILVLLPTLIAALNTIRLLDITLPLLDVLNQILGAIPNLFAAGILIFISYVIARVVARFVGNFLESIGFNALPLRYGIVPNPAGPRPSEIVEYLIEAAILLTASIEALQLLGFIQLSDLLSDLMILAGRILLGLLIFAVGVYLSGLAARAIQRNAQTYAGVLAFAARSAILVLATAIALRQMGIADEIVNLAFGLMLGSIAVAVALAFGIGGREIAARTLEEWRQSLREQRYERDEPGNPRPAPSGPVAPPTIPPTVPPTIPPAQPDVL
jgi:hypothetical protein